MIAMTIGIFSFSAVTVTTAGALDPKTAIQDGVDVGGKQDCGKDKNGKANDCLKQGIKTVVNVLLYVIGAVAVIMIIIGGLRYTISNGDSGQVTSAKNTILYAVIGLVVAILAYAIVNFIIGAF